MTLTSGKSGDLLFQHLFSILKLGVKAMHGFAATDFSNYHEGLVFGSAANAFFYWKVVVTADHVNGPSDRPVERNPRCRLLN